jgi:hypothetical protein
MNDPRFRSVDGKCRPVPDPFAYQFKAVATLETIVRRSLVYAAWQSRHECERLPIDAKGRVIDKHNPLGLPISKINWNGDPYDDSFLVDTRLRPMPHAGATIRLTLRGRHSPGTRYRGRVGAVLPVAEAIVAKKFRATWPTPHRLRAGRACWAPVRRPASGRSLVVAARRLCR